jgi:hypothetical protein
MQEFVQKFMQEFVQLFSIGILTFIGALVYPVVFQKWRW